MRILFICDGYYPKRNAASNCAFLIIDLLRRRGVVCDILNVTPSYDIPFIVKDGKGTIVSIRDDYRVDISDAKRSIIRLLRFCIFRFLGRVNQCAIKRIKYEKISKTLKRIGSQYDVIIPVVSDFNNGMSALLFKQKTHTPYIVYQVDPISSNRSQISFMPILRKFEASLFRNASFVITTPILKCEYARFGVDNDKIIAAEFPNVIDLTSTKIFDPDRIVCVFCGNLINGVRDCSYFLDLLYRIHSKKIFIIFVGSGQEDIIQKYSDEMLSGQIEHLGKMNREDSTDFIRNADFLINLGNSMTNQVPSKIFDYISTGIPIINICKNKHCPTIPYLERYGLAISVIESSDDTEKNRQANAIHNFMQSNLGLRNSGEFILQNFYRNTPRYVESQFWEAITRTVRITRSQKERVNEL